MEKMKLQFTLDEANLMIEALSRLPYERVFKLITNLQNQYQHLEAEQNKIKSEKEAEQTEKPADS